MASDRSQMAVFFTHGVSLDLWERRGLFSREIQFYESLAQQVGTIHLFTYGRQDAAYQSRLSSRLVIHPKRLPLPDLLYALVLPLIYWRVVSGCGLIRIHQLAGAIPALIAHWLTRAPLIVRGGFQWYTFATRQGASWVKRLCLSLIERVAYRQAHAVIHTTARDAQLVVDRYGVDPARVYVVSNVIDTELFKPTEPSGDRHGICYVGRLEPQKNLSLLIQALEGLSTTLTIYGEGSLQSALEQEAIDRHVNVRFYGCVSNEQLPDLLGTHELFVLPSLYEGNPKVLLEAMACELAVIGTDVEGIREIISHGATGLLCEPTAESLRGAIRQFLEDEILRERLGKAARAYIQDTASLTNAIQTETSLYPV